MDIEIKPSSWLDNNLTELRHTNIDDQLKAILGENEAETFLNPTIQDKPQTIVDQNYSKKAGLIGAPALWHSLRATSHKKILRNTKHLKACSAYSVSTKGNSKVINKIEEYKHQVELMHRVATLNESKTFQLMAHVKLPRLTGESITYAGPRQYCKSDQLELLNYPNVKKESNENMNIETRTSNIRDISDEHTMPNNVTIDNKIVSFVSEEECVSPGQFRQRMSVRGVTSNTGINKIDHTYKTKKESLNNNKITVIREYYSTGNITSNINHLKNYETQDLNARRKSCNNPRRRNSWQPLTVNALAEYTQVIPLPGKGMYRNGATKKWTPVQE